MQDLKYVRRKQVRWRVLGILFLIDHTRWTYKSVCHSVIYTGSHFVKETNLRESEMSLQLY